jgi:hypothetical protein
MPKTNILAINYNDDQRSIINKLNNNFDETLELHGGSQGIQGETGPAGPIGEIGPKGQTGNSGIRGSKWLISSSAPIGGIDNPIILSDYWVNSNDGEISIFTDYGWTPTGYNLNSTGDVFSIVESRYRDNASPASGLTGSSLIINQIDPSLYSFIFSDSNPEAGPTNPDLSKFVISTDSAVNSGALLEFSKTNLETGSPLDYGQHPVFKWTSPGINNSSLLWGIPGGSFSLGASGGISFSFDSSTLSSGRSMFINYGVGVTGTSGFNGIYATGGIQINSSNFVIDSKFLTYNKGYYSGPNYGSSLQIRNSFNLNYPNSVSEIPVLRINGLPGSLLSVERENDSLSASSLQNYVFSFKSQNVNKSYLDSRGKLLTGASYSPIIFPGNLSGITASASGPTGTNEVVSWYLLSQPYTETLTITQQNGILGVVPVTSGNTLVFTPNFPNLGGAKGSYVGIGFYSGSGGWNDTYSSTGPTASRNFLLPGESVSLTAYCVSDTYSGYGQSGFNSDTSNYNGFGYIGYGGTSGTVNRVVNLPFKAQAMDFTIYRPATGGGFTGGIGVYWRAYSTGILPGTTSTVNTGGSGGFFTIPDIY